ncbi:MAG: DUF4202 domain-containing protein [Desulfobulbia bacterium]
MRENRLCQIFELIDQANSSDPERVNVDGEMRPAEQVYGERMSAALERFCKSPGFHLQIAARAQHIERWISPRKIYPAGRAGYLKWRNDLKSFHARRAGELMREAGYEQTEIERVAMLIRKKGLKSDPEAQILEDVACLVFLEHYADEFIAEHNDEKVLNILKKTIRKMSPDGVAAAKILKFGERLADLLAKSLDDVDGGGKSYTQ